MTVAILPQDQLLSTLIEARTSLPAIDDMQVPTRIVRLPLSWDDRATRLAIEPIHAIRARGRALVPEQHRVHPPHQRTRQHRGGAATSCSRRAIWCSGSGDVYLGAPVATPIDPRHRLVTTKYNPARTWTPENAVGIGGAYLCVYGMEGPGGYQFVGPHLPNVEHLQGHPGFRSRQPWLLRFFDQIRFYPVSARGTARVSRRFRARPRAARHRPRSRLPARGLPQVPRGQCRGHSRAQGAPTSRLRRRASPLGGERTERIPHGSAGAAVRIAERGAPAGCIAVSSPVAGSVWRVASVPGRYVKSRRYLAAGGIHEDGGGR